MYSSELWYEDTVYLIKCDALATAWFDELSFPPGGNFFGLVYSGLWLPL